MTEALRKYLMPVFAPDDGTGGGADGDVADKQGGDAETDAAAAKAAEDAAKAAEDAGTGGKEGADAGKAEGDDKGKKESPWPDDWRDLIVAGAGKDADDLKKIANKYGGPPGMAKALLAAQREISTRGLAKPKPENASDEKAMSEWRKSVGIPDDPTGYKLPETITKALTDADKPVLSQFTEYAHKKGMMPDAVADSIEWYVESQAAIAEMQVQQDTEHKEACEDNLRAEWGAERKANNSLAIRFLDDSPLGHTGWAGLRDESGRMLGNDPDFLKWASDMGREKYGDGVFASSDTAQKHDNRRTEIETILKADRPRYFREKLDQEYAQILAKDEKRKK